MGLTGTGRKQLKTDKINKLQLKVL